MAEKSFDVRINLRDSEKVKRDLQSVGADGQRALKRIESASQPASRGLMALNTASAGLQGQLGGLSSRAGVAGDVLSVLGKGGLAAAAGLGAITVALAATIGQLRANVQHFGDLADAADRLGVSTSNLQALNAVFAGAGVSSDQLSTALERLNDTTGEAISGNEEAQQKFERLGISMDEVRATGGDTRQMLGLVADGLRSAGTMAEQTAATHDLFGRSAGALIPILREGSTELDRMTASAAESGKVLGEDAVRGYDELGDAIGRLATTSRTSSGEIFAPLIRGATSSINEMDRLLAKLGQFAAAVRSGDWDTAQNLMAGRAANRGPGATGSWDTPENDMLRLQDGAFPSFPRLRMTGGGGGGGGGSGGGGRVRTGGGRGGGGRSDPGMGLRLGGFDADFSMSGGQSLEDQATSIQEISYALEQARANADSFYATLSDGTEKAEQQKTIFGEMSDSAIRFGAGLASNFAAAAIEGENLNELTSQLPALVAKTITQLLIELAIRTAINSMMGSFGGGGGGLLSMLLSERGNAFDHGRLLPFEHGGAFAAGRLLPFASGGIVDRPTIFPMRDGTGLMGEAGPEAIMPLRRNPAGDLGVMSTGGAVAIDYRRLEEVIFKANVRSIEVAQKISGQQSGASQQRGGGKDVVAMLEQHMANQAARPGTNLNRAIGGNPIKAR